MGTSFGYSDELPEEIREVIIWIFDEISLISIKWDFYLDLFDNQETTDLLSKLANGAFYVIERSVSTDILLGINRLCDPIKTSNHTNISIKTLLERCDAITEGDENYIKFLEMCDKFRMIRNKILAHNDFDFRNKPKINQMHKIRREEIKEFISVVEEILKSVYQNYVDGDFTVKPKIKGDGKSLIRMLKIAENCEENKANDMEILS